MVSLLDAVEIIRRARRVRLLVSDVDGVLTDAGVYYSARGEELVRFSRRDGMAVELLRREGIDVAWLTRERSPIVAARADKLEIVHLFAGVRDKLAALPGLAAAAGVNVEQIAFIGDDVNDLSLIEHVGALGLCAAPADAHPSLAPHVHYRCQSPGGHGAFREFADLISSLRHEEQL
jgi:3-deoxy-D-manno-octulosonate 8-phosphate phosphatase (KDO 8-P phosphatase)